MKITVVTAFVMMIAMTASAARIRYTIDDDWSFNGQHVSLPHTWNAVDAFDKRVPYHRGVGVYRKTLTLDPSLRGRRLFLFFEGANQVADVSVNDHALGRHIGGYTAFAFEITGAVTFDKPNTIEVRVDNSPDPDIPPLSADFVFWGGIYRDVWLIATDPVHIDVLDHASPGVFISTEGDVVRIRAEVVNQSGRDVDVRVVNTILDADGMVVATASGGQARSPVLHVPHPHLWSPSSPYLYTVRTEVFAGSELVDSIDNPLGFRSFAVDAQSGFTLNGAPLRLYGTNRHEDYAGLGNAVPKDLQRRDIRLIKETGFNFLRLAHYPQDPAVLDASDRAGLVVWEEIPIVNAITTSDAFAANAEQMLVEMIRQHYNHPSVFFWGFMNEVTLRKPDPLPPHYVESVVALARRLNDRAHAEDSTRKTVMALSNGELDERDLASVADILGMNLYFGWYYGTFSDLGTFIDRMHRERPDRPLIVSEYGAGDDDRIHARQPKRFDFSAEYAQEFHRASFPQLEARPFLIATAVWNQFDFASPYRDDTKFGINTKGLFLYDRTPKDTSLYYRAALLDTPVLAIGRESTRPVTVYTNQPDCELFVNGQSLGTRKVENRTASWDVAFTPSENRIRARAGSLEDTAVILFPVGPLAVHAGSDGEFTDSSHVVWSADRGFTGGVALHTTHRIFDTNDDPLYQSAREGMSDYRFDVPDGAYSLTLHFAEIARDAKPGTRVFSVRINGVEVIRDLDLAASCGAFTAMSRTFTVEARDGRGVVIEFAAKSGQPCISAVMIRACIGC